MDEYVVKQLSDLSRRQSKYYQRVFEAKLDHLIVSDQSEQEYRNTKETITRLQTAISAQGRNMREAHESLWKYIEADIQEMTAELEKKQVDLHQRLLHRGLFPVIWRSRIHKTQCGSAD